MVGVIILKCSEVAFLYGVAQFGSVSPFLRVRLEEVGVRKRGEESG